MATDWSQSDSEVILKFALESSTGKEQLKVKIDAIHLSVTVAGRALFNEELCGKVNVDESDWQIEVGTTKTLVISLCKKKAVKWRALTKEEEQALPGADVLDANFDIMQLEHDDDDPERVEEQEENERKLEARYQKLVAERGIDDEETLNTFFALFDNCIQLYRLNKLSDYLEEVVPVCRKRGDKFYMKGIQALAFVRWKQSRFREALPLFHEMEQHLGKSAALCENIAHTYNSLGDFEKAEDYLRQALKFIEQEAGMNKGNRGGVLLGLGIVRDRLGKQKEALPVCLKAYEFYKERANGAPASLQAKAGISCAKIYAKLGDQKKAESYIREAVEMYEITCGETSPLTASAYHELGKVLWAQRRREDAQKALKRAYELEAMKDAWDLVTLLEIHNLLMDTHLKEATNIDRSKFAQYFKTAEYVVKRVKKELPQDGNAAVYYKAAAELKSWGGRYQEAKELFDVAIPLLKAETSTDCTGLLETCQAMKGFCDRNLQGTQDSPMSFSIPEADAGKPAAAEAEYQGPIIEDVTETEEMPGKAVDTFAAACSSSSSSAPAGEVPLEVKALGPYDAEEAFQICAADADAVFSSVESLQAHIEAAGAGLCWIAARGDKLLGVALCGSDGVFGHLLQLVQRSGADAKKQLVERCRQACQDKGLQSLRAAVKEDDATFKDLGWKSSYRVWTSPEEKLGSLEGQPRKKSRADNGTAASSAPRDPKLRRDDKDVNSYYQAWEQVNVDKALVAEEGLDPAVVPEDQRQLADFGDLSRNLDVSSKIGRFSWDQSNTGVSIYLPFDGVGQLPAENVHVEFRDIGFLLIITKGDKRHWYKVPNLCHPIDTTASRRTIKADQVVVKLRKQRAGEWSDLTDEKDRYQRKREYRIQHGDLKGATTEELLADMYKNANDEDRAGLRDAMRVNREKREEDARKAMG
ncbi:unnamed protein product [Effrenium voratum]|nr:unnamed protein product [Effrenium voratum]